ncbi:MAG TPA: hypothetical protein VF432_24575 [Thermoanaerobaculia bacterium]
MNVVRGRVVVAPSGRGIANLVVEAFEVEPETGGTKEPPRPRGRLGSGETNAKGEFRIEYEPPPPIDGSPSPGSVDLMLTISPPHRPQQPAVPVYVSQTARRRVGPVEVYLVTLSEDDLENAGGLPALAPPPGDPEPVSLAAARLLADSRRSVDLARAQREAERLKVDEARAVTTAFRNEFKPALERSLSSVSDRFGHPQTYVPPGGSVMSTHQGVMSSDLALTINNPGNRPPLRKRMALTDAQFAELRTFMDANNTVSAEDLRRVLGGPPPGSQGTYLREDPLAVVCREISREERNCATAIGAPLPPEPPAEPPPPNGDVPGDGVEVLEVGDVRRYLARLVSDMTSPEEGVLAGLEPRATRGTVGAYMKDLAFEPSPADTTAYYEFHNLQIAFRHVWQEAVDEGVLSLAEAAYDEIVEGGGNPNLSGGMNPLSVLTSEAQAVARARAKTLGDTVRNVGSWLPGFIDNLLQPDKVMEPRPPERLPALIAELSQRLQEPYAFTTFAANRQERSVNFGVRVTYQEEWKPLTYQAGRLAKTITLAPKEVRKYTKTVKRHRKRAEKEVEKHLSIRKDEMAQTSRVEQEVIRKATTKTHFEIGSESTAGIEGATPTSTFKTSFEREVGQVSENVKKSFNESVKKAVQELTDEMTVELDREETEDFEETESGEISNPNDELAVTFLFYELQRRYRITERIHRVSPVVLVAQEMPKPHEINEAWLVSHDWILRRVLLDDSFAPALSYLSSQVVGDQVALSEMKTNIAQQRQIISDLKEQLTIVRQRAATYRNLLEQSLLKKAEKSGGGGGGWFSGIPIVGEAVELVEDAVEAVGDFINPDVPGVGDSRQDTLKDTIQRTIDEERDLLMRLEREVTALNALTESYAKLLAENYNQRTQILRLRTHVKQNILYYMQAIWSHEPPDQRFLRLHETPVPVFGGNRSYHFESLEPVPGSMSNLPHRRFGSEVLDPVSVYEAEVVGTIGFGETRPLSRVADLDNLLGYFGNYMIFPLKESNALTDFMMEPYLLEGFDELVDPDDLGNWSLDEFVDYVCCLRDRLTAEQFALVRDELRVQYERLIASPRRNGDVVTIPTGSLFIEALPATASLIERFKAIHRAVDVKKAQADVRHAEIRNLWLVDRLLHDEREDPEIDKKVIIEGGFAAPSMPVDDPV